MFDKFAARCLLGWKSAYKMLHYRYQDHRQRYARFVHAMPKPLMCQECGGAGQVVEDVIDSYSLYGECAFCRGTGLITPWDRGWWLRWRKEEAQETRRKR